MEPMVPTLSKGEIAQDTSMATIMTTRNNQAWIQIDTMEVTIHEIVEAARASVLIDSSQDLMVETKCLDWLREDHLATEMMRMKEITVIDLQLSSRE